MTADDSTTLPLDGGGLKKPHSFSPWTETKSLRLCRHCGTLADSPIHIKEPTVPPPLVPPPEPPGWYEERARLRAEISEMKARLVEAKTLDDAKSILYMGRKRP